MDFANLVKHVLYNASTIPCWRGLLKLFISFILSTRGKNEGKPTDETSHMESVRVALSVTTA